jgi:hypothetical protein
VLFPSAQRTEYLHFSNQTLGTVSENYFRYRIFPSLKRPVTSRNVNCFVEIHVFFSIELTIVVLQAACVSVGVGLCVLTSCLVQLTFLYELYVTLSCFTR